MVSPDFDHFFQRTAKDNMVAHLHFSVDWKARGIEHTDKMGLSFFKSRANSLSFSYAPSEGRRKLSVRDKYPF